MNKKKKLILVIGLFLFVLILTIGGFILFVGCLESGLEKTSLYWALRGDDLYELGKYSQAIDKYNKALEIDPYYMIGWNSRRAALDYLPSRPQWLTYSNRHYNFSFQVLWDWIIGSKSTQANVLMSFLSRNSKFDVSFTECKNPKMTIYEHGAKFECKDNLTLAPKASIILIEYPSQIDFNKETSQYLNESKKDTELSITTIKKTTINNHEARLINFSRADRKGIEAWVKCNEERIISVTCSSLSSEFDQYQEKCLHIINSLRCG